MCVRGARRARWLYVRKVEGQAGSGYGAELCWVLGVGCGRVVGFYGRPGVPAVVGSGYVHSGSRWGITGCVKVKGGGES